MRADEYIPKKLTDKYGQIYDLDIDEISETRFDLNVLLDGRFVGQVFCKIDPPDELCIIDLNMFEWVYWGQPNWVRNLRKFFGLKVPRLDFRRLGLGPQLLGIVLAHANYVGVKHVWGTIVRKDRDNNPKLYEFYQKYGFQVTEIENPTGNTVALIDWYADDDIGSSS